MRKFVWAISLVLFLFGSMAFGQVRKIDSLKGVLEAHGEDTMRAKLLNELSKAHFVRSDFNESMSYANEALSLSLKLNFLKGIGSAQNNAGNVLQSLGEYPQALEMYFAALGTFERMNDKMNISRAYNNIGNVYTEQENYEKGREFYHRALQIKEEFGDKKGLAIAYSNIGNTYAHEDDLVKATEYHLKSLRIKEELGDQMSLATSYNNFGIILREMEEYARALDYFKRSLRIREQLGDKEGIANSNNNIGVVLVRMKRYQEAGKYLEKGLDLALKLRSKHTAKDSYRGLHARSDSIGDSRNALKYFQLYVQYNDSLINEENTKKSVRAQMQYEFDKKQVADSIKTAEQVKQEELKHEQEIQQQRTYTYGGVAAFVLMMGVAFVSFRANRQKQRANAIISEQKQLVETKQKEILDSIYYASRIQKSLLPTEFYMERNLKKLLR